MAGFSVPCLHLTFPASRTGGLQAPAIPNPAIPKPPALDPEPSVSLISHRGVHAHHRSLSRLARPARPSTPHKTKKDPKSATVTRCLHSDGRGNRNGDFLSPHGLNPPCKKTEPALRVEPFHAVIFSNPFGTQRGACTAGLARDDLGADLVESRLDTSEPISDSLEPNLNPREQRQVGDGNGSSTEYGEMHSPSPPPQSPLKSTAEISPPPPPPSISSSSPIGPLSGPQQWSRTDALGEASMATSSPRETHDVCPSVENQIRDHPSTVQLSESSLARATLVQEELVACFELVEKMGKGAVYLGSSRIDESHELFKMTQELSREVSILLGCTTWSGIGPGLMDAATRGAMVADRPAAGLKILMEASQSGPSWTHPYLPPSSYITCRSIAARKLGFLEAGRRASPNERTAFVALPGGIGTLDEIFDILTLIQLGKMETHLEVPFLAMNYGGCLRGLLEYFEDLEEFGAVAVGEVEKLWRVCDNNWEALEFLADFYEISEKERMYKSRLRPQ